MSDEVGTLQARAHDRGGLTSLLASPAPERRQRKSVAFADGETVVDENGDASTTVNGSGEKATAESHTQRTFISLQCPRTMTEMLTCGHSEWKCLS